MKTKSFGRNLFIIIVSRMFSLLSSVAVGFILPKVLSITDSERSPMTLYSSCNLVAKSDMVSIVDSLVAPLSVINALVVTLCMQRPEEVKESLTTLEEAWNNYQVYLNDEIDFIGEEPVLDYSLIKKDETNE